MGAQRLAADEAIWPGERAREPSPPGRGRRAIIGTMPDPGTLAELGTALGFEVQRQNGRVEVVRLANEFAADRAPSLLWSPRLWALIVFPRLRIPTARVTPTEWRGDDDARHIFEVFSARSATKKGNVRIEPYGLVGYGKALNILYWSDKWGDSGRYVHPFGPRVQISVAPRKAMWVFSGGHLCVTRDGIEN